MNSFKRQTGSTLLIALIMLILLTLIAVSAINSSSSSIQVIGNAQYRGEAAAVAQQALEQVISSSDFSASPASSVMPVDINNDGTADYTATVSVPTCTSTITPTPAQLQAANMLGSCAPSAKVLNAWLRTASGVLPSSQSWCKQQTWDVQASVNDSNTGANATVHQGVYMLVSVSTNCP